MIFLPFFCQVSFDDVSTTLNLYIVYFIPVPLPVSVVHYLKPLHCLVGGKGVTCLYSPGVLELAL